MLQQELRHLRLVLVHRRPKRLPVRRALFGQTRIRTMLEQQLHHLQIVAPRGGRNRPMMSILEIRQTRIARHQARIARHRARIVGN